MIAEISVVVPTFNRPAQLAQCLALIAEQDYPADRFEVIVVDDGGEVPAAPVVSGYAGNAPIQEFSDPKWRAGGCSEPQAGIARGRFLAFTDDDCTPSAGWLSALMARLRSSPEALVGGRIGMHCGNPCAAASQLILDFVYGYYRQHQGPLRFFSSNNMAVSRNLFQHISGFNMGSGPLKTGICADRWNAAGRQLIYEPEALVHHANDLNIRSFWQQHLAYGRGAFRLYRTHRRRCAGKTTINGIFTVSWFGGCRS
jgi:hypothetical protein